MNIVGVQFRRAGRIYDFLAGDIDLKVGDDVVVETERGPSLAKVAQLRFDQVTSGAKELKSILRLATARDLDEARKLTPEYATNYARERVERLQLRMSILQSEVQFGGNKVIIYFSAAGRVDFRELVKELASGLKARVELKQVGARDEAKLVGGIGICGREFCCSSFLREFVPVSIKMAKNQNLALNPSKVSGGCGRLLCCLTYENDLYSELRRQLPPKGARAHAVEENMTGQVIKTDILNQIVVLMTEDGRQVTVPVSKIEVIDQIPVRSDGDESEAEIWGEDIDLSLLSSLEDESETRARADKASRDRAGKEQDVTPSARGRDERGGYESKSRERHRRDRGGHHRGQKSDDSKAEQTPKGSADTDRNEEGGE